jgi:hypothetical protein
MICTHTWYTYIWSIYRINIATQQHMYTYIHICISCIHSNTRHILKTYVFHVLVGNPTTYVYIHTYMYNMYTYIHICISCIQPYIYVHHVYIHTYMYIMYTYIHLCITWIHTYIYVYHVYIQTNVTYSKLTCFMYS